MAKEENRLECGCTIIGGLILGPTNWVCIEKWDELK